MKCDIRACIHNVDDECSHSYVKIGARRCNRVVNLETKRPTTTCIQSCGDWGTDYCRRLCNVRMDRD